MTKVQLVPTGAPGAPPAGAQAVVAVGGPLDTGVVNPVVGGSIDSVRQEIDDAFADMKSFLDREPDEIMRMCGGHSARLSELRVRVQRVEDVARAWKPVRTREIEPALDELTKQFNIASRLHSVRDLDFRMTMGAP